MGRVKLLGLLFAIAGYYGPAQALPLIDNAGLTNASKVVTFGEVVLPEQSSVKGQYDAAHGVTFVPELFYNTPTPPKVFFPPGFLANFTADFQFHKSASIVFSQVVNAAAFALQTPPGQTTFEALLDGLVIESFTTSTTDTSQSNFYGFTGIVFREISIASNSSFFLLDNLQYSPASVPEPGALGLLGLGFAGLLIRKRRATA